VQQLGVGMFVFGGISDAFLSSTFSSADTANASIANFNPFTKEF
jgi:hypothetical protein